MTYYLIYLSISFFITYVAVYPTKKLAKTYQILSIPNDISNRKVPYFGGIAVYLGFILTFILFCYMKFPDREINISLNNPNFLAIVTGAIIVTFSGLIYDVYPHSFIIRLSVQIFAGFTLAFYGMGIDVTLLQIFPIAIEDSTIYLGNTCATILWTIIIMNSLDHMNSSEGVFSNIAIVTTMLLFAFAVVGDYYENALILSIIIGCLLGIFIEQAKPSKILLGKTGTYFLSFVMVAMSMDLSYSSNRNLNALIPFLLFAVPVLCSLFSVIKKNIFIDLKDRNVPENRQLFFFTISNCLLGGLAFILANV